MSEIDVGKVAADNCAGEVRRALVVCTANVCRSPTVALLLQRRLDAACGGRRPWTVTSAGTASIRAPIDQRTIDAATAFGLDLRDHRARCADREMLAADGADLVITMTREHLRSVIVVDRGAWERTFTLKEIVRRAEIVPPAGSAEPLPAWLRRLAEGRRAADMMVPDARDDVADPYGAPLRAHEEMIDEVSRLIDRLVAVGPPFFA